LKIGERAKVLEIVRWSLDTTIRLQQVFKNQWRFGGLHASQCCNLAAVVLGMAMIRVYVQLSIKVILPIAIVDSGVGIVTSQEWVNTHLLFANRLP
jgi:hypothetical protein